MGGEGGGKYTSNPIDDNSQVHEWFGLGCRVYVSRSVASIKKIDFIGGKKIKQLLS